jgi:2-dehydro-3-deoxygluconokinase
MVVTIGETMMVFNGPADAPISVHAALLTTFAGAESNVAIALARLGHAARYLSVFGDDAFGRTIVRGLRGEGVDVAGVQFSTEQPTGVMFKERWPGGEPSVFYYRSNSALAHANAGTFEATLWRAARVIYLTGITPALSPSCRELVRRVLEDARANQIPVWFDPNYRAKLWARPTARAVIAQYLPLIDTIVAGMEEGRMLSGREEPEAVAAELMRAGVKRVVLKTGGRGAVALDEGGAVSRNGFDVGRVVDPIGAGDAFAAGFLSGHVDGLNAEGCLERGHALAAMVCMTHGDWEGLPDRRQLEEFLARRGEARR